MYLIVVVTLESDVDTPVNCHQIISSIMFHGQLDIGVRKNQVRYVLDVWECSLQGGEVVKLHMQKGID